MLGRTVRQSTPPPVEPTTNIRVIELEARITEAVALVDDGLTNRRTELPDVLLEIRSALAPSKADSGVSVPVVPGRP